MTLELADGRGELFQWDTGRIIEFGEDAVSQAHFTSTEKVTDIPYTVEVKNGKAAIPDELLQVPGKLIVYAWVSDTNGGYTKVQVNFPVFARPKPSDYVYTPTDQMTLQTIQRQIGDLADLTTEAKDTLVAAINEVARTGGAGSMGLRVADGYIQYSTDGGSTWQNLIAVADLKGAKGDTGATGPAGASGKDGHTPVKGTDYWTAADKQEIIDDTKNAIDLSSYAKLSNLAPLAGTTTELTPAQVHQAILAGTPVVVKYTDSAYGELSFTSFNVANEFGRIVSQTIVYYGGNYILAELVGDLNGKWGFDSATLAEKKDIPTVPSSLKNPNALTIKIGSTTVTYDGSAAQTVTIDDGTEVSY